MTYELAADVGGTFTDLVLRVGGREVNIYKTSTTPGNISNGILNGIEMIATSLGLDIKTFLRRCTSFACGTTIATNAILENRQAKTGLICSEGFRDTLLIREGGKADSYDFYMDYPAPYIPRCLTIGVPERINAEGGVEIPLNEAAVKKTLSELREKNVEAIAVSLLWSIVNPSHEKRIGEIIEAEMPGIPYSLGHQVNPSIREYRRTLAAAIDASLKPLVQARIEEIKSRLSGAGFSGELTFITSSGGRTSPDEVIERPISLCLSGPSGAPQAGCRLARSEGIVPGSILTTDMGGTSFEVSVSVDWKTPMHREVMLGNHLFGVPAVEVKSIGSGGGSIAYLDAGGFIHVGPESAGAIPGPACYGRGGNRPTVTDANLVRGFLLPDTFASKQLVLDVAAAERVIREEIAEPLRMDVQEAANLICLVAEQNMVSAIQDITIKRGVDPRNFTLVSGGAAGGLHVSAIARELGIRNVLIPRAAGVLSAYGIMTGAKKMSFAHSLFTHSEAFNFKSVNALLDKLRADGLAFLDRMGVSRETRELKFSVEARYAGQVWQITLPFAADRLDSGGLETLVENFHALHETYYAVRSTGERVEFTEWNLDAMGPVSGEERRTESDGEKDPAAALIGHSEGDIRECGGKVRIPVYDGMRLEVGARINGPALVQEPVTVNFVPPDASGRVTAQGGLLITMPVQKQIELAV
ncbi:hydantoinase/oxoprolinase family protein [Bradyrhizobium mercantei]|uniref:hydantoinase/oxoprolinase family protein n=1 Tax=Bradyrhizobium mercantei TaxID=1904807 RepID=UPI000975ADFC|nr:hydantoinase/oxoprolinase family protein [Bradyrhizobium mercantei]